VLIIKNESKVKKKESFIKKLWVNRKSIVYLIYSKFDSKIFNTTPDAFELKNITELLNVDRIKIKPKKTIYRDYFKSKDINLIEKYNIDILIRLGFRILSGDILSIAKYGVWSYHHGDNKVNRGFPAGFWEVMKGWDETGTTLQILNEKLDGGSLLFKSYSLTNNQSVNKNINSYYWKSQSFMPNKIKELFLIGEDLFLDRVKIENSNPQFYSNKLYSIPSNKDILTLLFKKSINMIKNRILNLFYFNQWVLLFNLNSSNTISTSFYQFTKILPPKDRFWADPHVVKKGNKYFIFIEEYIFKKKKGFISVIEMDEFGNYKRPTKVLEKDYHLSYPFLIEDNDNLYMIPETSNNKTIELYKCVDFPLEWEFEQVLMDNINAVDTTVIYKNHQYWLFTNIAKNKGSSNLDELYVFYSKSLISKNWKPHNQNPIKSDVKSSRPAGNFFTHNNELFRPSQNNSKHYGFGMKINKVESISNDVYEENEIDAIYPNWEKSILGTHTINSQQKLTVIDALLRRKRLN